MFSKLKELFTGREDFEITGNSKIIIFGWTRTGSSNLGEIVKSVTQLELIYEPFHPKKGIEVKTIKQLKKETEVLWENYDGLKHVTRLDKKLDEFLLLHPDHKIIFLWRTNISKRVISELLGRQTKVFGSLNDNKSLRKNLEKVSYKNIDIHSFDRTCNKYREEVEYFKDLLVKNDKPFYEVKFEDLFENEIDFQKKLVQNLCSFLGSDFNNEIFEDIKWRFEDKMKQSSSKIYESIPNIKEIQELIEEKNYGKLF